jgi:KipI family sensor histidine kinase inhibitor
MRVLPCGERALLLEPESRSDVLPLRRRLAGIAGVEELVPAARTLLVRIDPEAFDRTAFDSLLGDLPDDPAPATTAALELAVRYDGADLGLVAETARCSVEDVVRRHTGTEYVVAFCGFAPGFAYLTGLDPVLRQPRLSEPRTVVPAGSVGVAGEFTGVYPRSSPGGWRLLGRTDARLWDVERPHPALLTPGTRVRFVES